MSKNHYFKSNKASSDKMEKLWMALNMSIVLFFALISTLYAKAQSPDEFHICYFSLNNEKEFTEMEKFTKKLNQYSSRPISVREYMTEGGDPEESFREMVNENVRCDGLVISGHHTGSFGGKRARGSLGVGFLEKISCDEKYSDWFKNIQALWLQGCRTLGTGEIVPDQQEEIDADYHTMRVGNVLAEDHLEQSLADLDMEFSATLDQDNPLSSRYLRVFPRATVFGWTKTAPGEKSSSQYSIPFHIAHIARLNSKDDQFPESNPIDETLDQASALQYTESLINLLNRKEGDNECEDLSVEAWKSHGRVEDQRTGLGFLNPDLNAYPALARSDNDLLRQARLLDCLLNNSKDEESLLRTIDEIMKNPQLIHYTFNSLLDKLKTLKNNQPDLHKKILDKLKASSEMNEFLTKKLQSPSLGILRKIDYFAFYEGLYGKSDKIRSALLDQSINILKANQSNISYDMRDYKMTLLSSLRKHGLLNHPKGIRVLEQAIKDSDEQLRMDAVGAAGDIGEAAFHIVEKGMKDSSDQVRATSVEVAGEIGEVAFHIVKKGVKDSSGQVRAASVRVAGDIGEAALPIIEQAMEDSETFVRLIAVEEAERMGESAHLLFESKGLPIVEQVMEDKDLAIGMHFRAVELAGKIGEPARLLFESKGLPILDQALEHSDPWVNGEAIRIAGELGELALPIVKKALQHSEPRIVLEAITSAGKIGESALPALRDVVEPSDAYDFRLRMVHAAGDIGEAALPLLERYRRDPDVGKYVIGRAINIGEPALPLIEEILDGPLHPDWRSDALSSLPKIGEAALPLLRKKMDPGIMIEFRLQAVGAAGKLGEPARSMLKSQGLPIVEEALNSPELDIQMRGVRALGNIGDLALPLLESKGLSTLEQGIESSDEYMRWRASRVLKGNIPHLRKLLEKEDVPRDTKERIKRIIHQAS